MGKFKFSYKRFAVTVMVGAILAATTATAAFSYAWFTNHNNVTNNDLHGSTAGAYFARGNGSPTNPYVINKPIHLYNLAWLQYIGAFDDEEPYFIIEADLDMKDWTLPPIGTTEHPFKGHLNGYDKTHSQNQTSTAKISNLTISNSFGDFDRHPSSVTTFTSPEITGLFGVIKKISTTDVPSVQNLYIDNLTVTSKTDSALTGLVAGYVDGQLERIGINNSKLDIKNGTSKLDGYDNISKYTSVGYCTENYETSYVKTNTTMYKPEQVGKVSFNPTGGGGGTENDWGGSVDMLSLDRRLNYISAVSNIETTGAAQYISPKISKGYQLNGYLSSSVAWGWNEKTYTYYITDGALLPLNVDENVLFDGDKEITVKNKWNTMSYYQENTSEYSTILDTNTGYLVGAGNDSGSKIRSTPHSLDKISKSYVITGSGYNGEYLTLSTIDTTKGTSTILVEPQNFQKFEKVKSNFDSSMSGMDCIHGFHFSKYIDENSLDILTLGEKFSAKISGVDCPSTYQFIKGGLNFTVSKPGYITTITGAYYNGYDYESLFELFKIERDPDGQIISTKRIRKIYKNSEGEIEYSYDGSNLGSNYELIFNFDNVSGIDGNNGFLRANTAYYFEMPVLPGDYVIGKAIGTKDRHAYLMYLDIGANAGGTSGNKVDRTKIYEVFEQVNEEFKYPNGVEIVNFANAAIDTKKFAVVVGVSYTGEVKLNYAGGNNASVIVTESNDTGLGYFDAGLNFTTGQTKQVGSTTTHTRTQRLTYFDYYRESELGTEALYTNVLQFSQTQTMASETWGAWGDITRSDYRSGAGNTDFKEYTGGVLTIFGDDGKSTTTKPDIKAPESYGSSTVFTLQTMDPTVPSINADWIQTGSYPTGSDTSPYVFKVSGYKFTMKYTKDGASTTLEDNQYSTSTTPYNVSINGTPLPKA